jgi:hypothetical protein
MKNKVSLWIEDATAAACFIALMVFAPITTFSLERAEPARVAPAASRVEAPLLSLPLQCDAWITQSGDGIDTPRARCYTSPSTKGQ